MREITLDFSGIRSKQELHDLLIRQFRLPDYYGRNLDALWDCLLGSFAEDTTIVIRNLQALPEPLQPLAASLRALFLDLDSEEAHVRVIFRED